MITTSLAVKRLHEIVTSKNKRFQLDLSNSSLITCCNEYIKFQRKENKKFTCPVVNKIAKLQDLTNETFDPDQVTDEFWKVFIVWLQTDEGLLPSTAENYCTQLRVILKWANRHGATVDPDFEKFAVDKFRIIKPALTLYQVHTLYNFDFSKLTKTVTRKQKVYAPTLVERTTHKTKNGITTTKVVKKERVLPKYISVEVQRPVLNKTKQKTYERVRDMLVLSCMLYQRHSDTIRIKPNCFNEDKSVFTIVQQKTGNTAIVDLKKYCMDYRICKEILEKYNYTAPYVESINIFNKHIHDMLKLIGGDFLSDIKIEYKQLGVIKSLSIPMYKVISSHIGRRTAITHAVMVKNHPHMKVMQCSGHSDFRSFQLYLRNELDQ